MSEEKVVTYELEGEIALIGLNRPDKRNALSPELMKELRDAALRAGDEAKCGIIFGHGGNFCAGLDLAWAAENWKEGQSQRLPFQFNRNSYQEVIARGNIPFIAALHGATLGGGLETAACAHIRVADEVDVLRPAGGNPWHLHRRWWFGASGSAAGLRPYAGHDAYRSRAQARGSRALRRRAIRRSEGTVDG